LTAREQAAKVMPKLKMGKRVPGNWHPGGYFKMTKILTLCRPSLAQIEERFYWTLEAVDISRGLNEGSYARIADGFAKTRDEAVGALCEAIDRADPGSKLYRAHTTFSQFDRLCIETLGAVTYGASEEAKSFARNPEKGLSWARANRALVHEARRLYEVRYGMKPGAKAGIRRAKHLEPLGLGAAYTRTDVIKAFRARSKEYHPDCGGDSEMFRLLVQARQRALAEEELKRRSRRRP
jgi:hypothetical protein